MDLLEAIEIETDKGETARLRYDPPVPYEPQGIAVGDTRTILTTLRMDSAGFALPCKTTIERLADETITAPAGDFAGCLHYRSVTASTFNVKIAKIPMTEERERWYHPAVQGMVKEVYRRGPVKFLGWSRPGYTATSVLIAYDRQEPEQAHGTCRAPEGTITPTARELLASKPDHARRTGPSGWILPVLHVARRGRTPIGPSSPEPVAEPWRTCHRMSGLRQRVTSHRRPQERNWGHVLLVLA